MNQELEGMGKPGMRWGRGEGCCAEGKRDKELEKARAVPGDLLCWPRRTGRALKGFGSQEEIPFIHLH